MSAKKHHEEPLALEVTVLSADSLRSRSSFHRLRPYVVLSSSVTAADGLHCTRVDEERGASPTWGDVLRVPVGASFLRGDEGAAVRVVVLSRRRISRPSRLGCFRILPADILDGLRPPAAQRRLSYALRHPIHGGKGHGVVHVAVRLMGPGVAVPQTTTELAPPERDGWCRVAIGVPVARPAAFPPPAWARKGTGSFVAREDRYVAWKMRGIF